ncbi:MAG: response regulator [Selenomonadaceae bacterium]|nr:response regulator [Selenomonadaceae bacterium]
MKIAIVDDQPEDLNAAKTFLKRYLAKKFPETFRAIQIDSFSGAEDFLKSFKPAVYDLMIFDIFMKPLNGIQIAQIVRSKDHAAAIIFLTSSEDFILEGYRVFAVGYFIKPLADNAEQFDKTCEYFFPKLWESQKKIAVRINGVDTAIPYKSIRYVDIFESRRLCIHATNIDIFPSNTYEEISSELEADARFVECYHRIILNMDFVKFMDVEDFVLTDGTRIPISQRKSKAAKLKYMTHLIETGSANTASL